MSASDFAKMKEMELRIAALEREMAELKKAKAEAAKTLSLKKAS